MRQVDTCGHSSGKTQEGDRRMGLDQRWCKGQLNAPVSTSVLRVDMIEKNIGH